MNKDNIKKRKEKKTIVMCIRITPGISNWLKENQYSPSGIFYEALRDLNVL